MGSKIISLYNAKGGVGKTTSAANIATILALKGKKVLVIDLDLQGNATSLLGIDKTEIVNTSLDILVKGLPISQAIIETKIKKLSVTPKKLSIIPNKRISEYQEEKVNIDTFFNKEESLKKLLSTVANRFDYIIIDCPPSLSELTVNALTVSTEVLVPIKVDSFAFDGLAELSQKVDEIRRSHNKNLNFLGVFFTMVPNTRVVKQVREELEGQLGKKMFKSFIRNSNAVVESTFEPAPVVLYSPKSTAALDYIDLVQEIISKGRGK